MDDDDSIPHPISVTEDTDDTPEQPENKTYVDADADLTEFEENYPDPHAILRDDQFALIQPEAVRRWE